MVWDKRTWIAVISLTLAIAVIVSLVFWYRRGTPPPSVPEAGTTVQIQTAVNSAVKQVQETRRTNDEAIRRAYQDAKAGVDCLSADAVVSELNALLDELRQRDAE